MVLTGSIVIIYGAALPEARELWGDIKEGSEAANPATVKSPDSRMQLSGLSAAIETCS